MVVASFALLVGLGAQSALTLPAVATSGDVTACRVDVPATKSKQARATLPSIIGGDRGVACPFSDGQPSIVYLACSSLKSVTLPGRVTRMSRADAVRQSMACSPTWTVQSAKMQTQNLDTIVFYGLHPDTHSGAEQEWSLWMDASLHLASDVRALGLPIAYYQATNDLLCVSAPSESRPTLHSALPKLAARWLPAGTRQLTSHRTCPELVEARFGMALATVDRK